MQVLPELPWWRLKGGGKWAIDVSTAAWRPHRPSPATDGTRAICLNAGPCRALQLAAASIQQPRGPVTLRIALPAVVPGEAGAGVQLAQDNGGAGGRLVDARDRGTAAARAPPMSPGPSHARSARAWCRGGAGARSRRRARRRDP